MQRSPALDADGYLLLRQAFDPGPLEAELRAALRESRPQRQAFILGQSGAYVPAMGERTPRSLELLLWTTTLAADLLGRPCLPGRAKAVWYAGQTGWHADSDLAWPSLGFAGYLAPLSEHNGALQVIPGSHRGPSDKAPVVLETRPGDLIVFHEHLQHRSQGGTGRLQWRSDAVAQPESEVERALVRTYFSRVFSGAWEEAYDAAAYPSYGERFRDAAGDAAAALEALGVFGMAARFERREPPP
ncbi:MAG: phytanoyl-CoA dioxygenase family protein [Myxococcota bacterium]